MSTAHRPTWNPAVGKEVKSGSRQFSTRDVASHTKLKFRQPGQGGTNEVEKRDLRAQLLKAEAEARAKKRKAGGLLGAGEDSEMQDGEETTTASSAAAVAEIEDRNPDEVKRRKLLEDIALDKDDDDDDDDEEDSDDEKETAKDTKMKGSAANDDADDSDEEEDEEDDEDESAELLRELEKIRRERAEEQARKVPICLFFFFFLAFHFSPLTLVPSGHRRVQEQEANAANAAAREAEIATSNPLLNLQAALGSGSAPAPAAGGSFAVRKRWDDDLIFKNQANGQSDKPSGQFVNDLLRTEFHRKFMHKFIK
ncbi:hypothetical protein FRC17_003394 [Serendipita sp. 399]|nr:hypothetical protein FRC17_003394 [Serendipita sp. 399]